MCTEEYSKERPLLVFYAYFIIGLILVIHYVEDKSNAIKLQKMETIKRTAIDLMYSVTLMECNWVHLLIAIFHFLLRSTYFEANIVHFYTFTLYTF